MNSLLNWLSEGFSAGGWLSYFGLYYKDAKILFLGLDNAGKTTLMGVLKEDRVLSHNPTFMPSSHELVVGSTRIQAFDLGGHQAARKIWRDYFPSVDGIIFIVDSTDRGRFPEARTELTHLLEEPCLWQVPIVVLGNKVDDYNACSQEALQSELGLYSTFGKENNKYSKINQDEKRIEVFMCSVVRKMGYGEGLKWLSDQI